MGSLLSLLMGLWQGSLLTNGVKADCTPAGAVGESQMPDFDAIPFLVLGVFPLS